MMRSIGRCRYGIRLLSVSLAALLAATPMLAEAQDAPTGPPSSSPAAAAPNENPSSPAPAGGEPSSAARSFSQEELRNLLAPIALYPDALLAQVLPASAYPLDIVQAHRWLEQNSVLVAKNDFSGIDNTNWDPAVKALARFPDVMKKLDDNIQWTTDLGDAFVSQPQDVAAMIQQLRAEAEKAGTLKSSPQQTVTTTTQSGQNYIAIEPAEPGVVYVPSYDPVAAYEPYSGAAPLLAFGVPIAVGALWANNYWNWGGGWVSPPVWPGYPGWRPPYAGWRQGQALPPRPPGGWPNNPNGPWRPGGDYRPGQGIRPGAAQLPANRPGAGDLPGGGNRPGVGGPGNRPGIGNRPGGRPSARPVTRAAAVGAARSVGRAGGGFHGVGRVGGVGGARFGGVRGGGIRGGGFRGGGFRGGGGGFRGGGFRGGGGGFRGGGRGGRGGGGGGRRRSDMRLKHDIVLLGRLDDGLGYYRFVYNGGHTAYVGVLAQEVEGVAPQAVTLDGDGYLRVSYDRLGLPFETYRQWIAAGAHLPPVKPVAH